MKFRETQWFKKGLVEDGGEEAPAPLPIEDRYVDDGTLAPSDSTAFGLHTGVTQMLKPIETVDSAGVPERALIAEMKGGRARYLAVLAGSALALGGALMFLT